MSDSSPLPPVRLTSAAELARDALSAPLLARAARLARWAARTPGSTRAADSWRSSCPPPPRSSG